MSITRRYIVFDEIDKEESMGLFYEELAHNDSIQYIKNTLIPLIEQPNDAILINLLDEL